MSSPLYGRLSPGLTVMLRGGEEGAGLGYDPSEALPPGEGDQFVDVERYADDLRAGTLQGFQFGEDGRAIRLEVGLGDTVADITEPGIVFLVRPEDGDKVWLHGVMLTIVAGNSIVAGEGGAASALLEGQAS